MDLIIGDQVVVELKVVKELAPVFEAQLLTYMRLTEMAKQFFKPLIRLR